MRITLTIALAGMGLAIILFLMILLGGLVGPALWAATIMFTVFFVRAWDLRKRSSR